jgi:uncharacterized protein (TIGR03067 family)
MTGLVLALAGLTCGDGGMGGKAATAPLIELLRPDLSRDWEGTVRTRMDDDIDPVRLSRGQMTTVYKGRRSTVPFALTLSPGGLASGSWGETPSTASTVWSGAACSSASCRSEAAGPPPAPATTASSSPSSRPPGARGRLAGEPSPGFGGPREQGQELLIMFQLGALLLGMGTLAGADAPSKAGDVEGTWTHTLVFVERFGPNAEATLELKFTGTKFTYAIPDMKVKGEGTFTIDPKKNPKHIDFNLGRDGVLPCLYERSGDTLKLCVNWSTDERPQKLEENKAKKVFIWVFKQAPAKRPGK